MENERILEILTAKFSNQAELAQVIDYIITGDETDFVKDLLYKETV